MADYYVNALDAVSGIAGAGSDESVSGLENLGSAASRVGGLKPGEGAGAVDRSDINFSRPGGNGPSAANRQMADLWETIRRGDSTYMFSTNTDAQNRYQAAAEARANELVASFAGDPEDIREVRDRILKGEPVDSILRDVREKRHDLNVAAAVAQDRSSAQAVAHNDIVDPNIHESSSVAVARHGSTAGASSGPESSSSASAVHDSTAGAYADQNSHAKSVASYGSQAVTGAFEQSTGMTRANDRSEATVDANNGARATAQAEHQGTGRAEARNDATADSRASAGQAHAEATDGATARASSTQDLKLKYDPQHQPQAEALGRNRSQADAQATGPDSHAWVLADDESQGQVKTGPGQSQDVKASPPRTPDSQSGPVLQ